MKKLIILIPLISLFLFSCRNTVNEKSNEQTQSVIQQENHHNDESEAIELNNGEK